jgi:hypothetical protein
MIKRLSIAGSLFIYFNSPLNKLKREPFRFYNRRVRFGRGGWSMMAGFAVFIINDDRKPVNGFPVVVKNLQS